MCDTRPAPDRRSTGTSPSAGRNWKRALRRRWFAAALLPLLALTPVSASSAPARQTRAAPPQTDIYRYTVRPGDTLYALANAHLRRLADWKTVRRLNHVADPLRLLPGTVLHIPLALLRTEPLQARVAAFRGAVRIGPADRLVAASPGAVVTPGMILESGANSFLSLRLSNGSLLTLPSQTRIRVTTMRRITLTNSVDFDFMVEKGHVETSVTPLGNPQSHYRIRTPIAVSAVRGTHFRVAYAEPDKPSLTEVLEGTVGVGTSEAHALMPVEKGFGASVSTDGRTLRAALLPPPDLTEPGRVQVDPLVALRPAPMPGASAYHVQISPDAGFVDLLRDGTAAAPGPDAAPEFRFSDVPNGRWFVRLTAIDTAGLEGLPQTYTMTRKLTGLTAAADATGDGGYRFRWSGEGEGRRVYHFRLRPDRPDAAPLVDEPGLTGDSLVLSDLPPGTYLWQIAVRQTDADGESRNSLPEQRLIVAPVSPSPRRR